jgi:CRISPR/Cas system-associated endoribonuclease Cas2
LRARWQASVFSGAGCKSRHRLTAHNQSPLSDMLLSTVDDRRAARLAVIAYDISMPKRARRVRRLLNAIRIEKQYSVFETCLLPSEFYGVIAELTTYCNLDRDRLAVWWPRDVVRLEWTIRHFRPASRGPAFGDDAAATATMKKSGNFIISYDVSDPGALDRIAGVVSAEGTMMQRSVYWLRLSYPRLIVVLERCARHLSEQDAFWIHPLQSASGLWRIGNAPSTLLPVTSDRWARATR